MQRGIGMTDGDEEEDDSTVASARHYRTQQQLLLSASSGRSEPDRPNRLPWGNALSDNRARLHSAVAPTSAATAPVLPAFPVGVALPRGPLHHVGLFRREQFCVIRVVCGASRRRRRGMGTAMGAALRHSDLVRRPSGRCLRLSRPRVRPSARVSRVISARRGAPSPSCASALRVT